MKKPNVPIGALDICTKCGKLRGPVKYLPAFKRGVICMCEARHPAASSQEAPK